MISPKMTISKLEIQNEKNYYEVQDQMQHANVVDQDRLHHKRDGDDQEAIPAQPVEQDQPIVCQLKKIRMK